MAGSTIQEKELAGLLEGLERERVNLARAEKKSDAQEEIRDARQKIAIYETRIDLLLEDGTPKDDAPDNLQVPKGPESKGQQHSLSPPVDYWPSTNTSPFTVNTTNDGNSKSLSNIGQASSAGLSGDFTRKRSREGSTGDSPAQPSKKAAPANPMKQRHQNLDKLLEERLEKNREMFASMRVPAEVTKCAKMEGLSEEEYLEELAQDEEESARSIRWDIQIEKDQDLARMLQHNDDDELDDSPFALPYRAQPGPSMPSTPLNRPPQPQPLPLQTPSWRDPKTEHDSDSDVQEIPRALPTPSRGYGSNNYSNIFNTLPPSVSRYNPHQADNELFTALGGQGQMWNSRQMLEWELENQRLQDERAREQAFGGRGRMRDPHELIAWQLEQQRLQDERAREQALKRQQMEENDIDFE